MHWSVNELRGYTLRATDGDLGSVADVFFDDARWIVRYLVVDTARWLVGRRVLLVPAALGEPDRGPRVLPVNLTRSRIEASPEVDADKPVSRQQEISLHGHYGWWPYWSFPGGVAAAVPPVYATDPVTEGQLRDEAAKGDPHLRSAVHVTGYHVAAADGNIGHVEDFLIESDGWRIRYLVVDTRNWLPGRKVVVPPAWVRDVSWEAGKVAVALSRDQVKDSPEYDPATGIDRAYEERLHRHYGKIPYWTMPPD